MTTAEGNLSATSLAQIPPLVPTSRMFWGFSKLGERKRVWGRGVDNQLPVMKGFGRFKLPLVACHKVFSVAKSLLPAAVLDIVGVNAGRSGCRVSSRTRRWSQHRQSQSLGWLVAAQWKGIRGPTASTTSSCVGTSFMIAESGLIGAVCCCLGGSFGC